MAQMATRGAGREGESVRPGEQSGRVIDLRARRGETAPPARSDDHAAFAAVIADNDGRLRALAYHVLGTRDAMDDVLQEVYLKAYRNLATFRGESSLATWLYRITYTTCIDRTRRDKTRQATTEQLEIRPPHTAGADETVAVRDQLHRALAALPPEQCAAVLLVLRDGYPYADAAEILGVPAGTVASRVTNGRRQLAAALSAEAGGGERS